MNSLRQFWCSLHLILMVTLVPSAQGQQPPITGVRFAPDGDSVIACSQLGLTEYSWPKLEKLRAVKVMATNLHDLAFSPDLKRLAVAGGSPAETGNVQVLSWPELAPLVNLGEHADVVMAVRWIDNRQLITASSDHTMAIWSTESAKPLKFLKGHSRGVNALALLADDQKIMVSAGIDQSLRVWNLESDELMRSMNNHTLPVNDLAVRPGGDGLPVIASAAKDKTVRIWQPQIGRLMRFARLKTTPLSIAWSNDGNEILAACTDGAVYVIDANSVSVAKRLTVLNGWAYCIAADPKSDAFVVAGNDGQIKRIEP